MTCKGCQKRENCISLCAPAEKFANQDYVYQRDLMLDPRPRVLPSGKPGESDLEHLMLTAKFPYTFAELTGWNRRCRDCGGQLTADNVRRRCPMCGRAERKRIWRENKRKYRASVQL